MKRDQYRGFVFYTRDYFGDAEVRLMPGHLRIVWVEAFFLMDQSPRRGVLLKKSGEPYSAGDLATLMNVPVEDVETAFAWVVREGIASVDRATKTLVCRRMMRDENRSKFNRKNGKKGGNPLLLRNTFENDLDDSLNRLDKAKTEPDPDPDPEKGNIHNSSPVDLPSPKTGHPPPKPTARKIRAPLDFCVTEAMRAWAEENGILVDINAETEHMLDHFRSKGETRLDWVATWRTWMRNCKKFEQRRNGASNGKPKEHYQDRVARENRETAQRINHELFDSIGDGSGPEDTSGSSPAVLQGPIRHR